MVKSLVYGGLDGITTSLSVVCAGVGAELEDRITITMGFALLVAAAISMGVGDALSEKAELDYVRREWQRESWYGLNLAVFLGGSTAALKRGC